MSNNIIPFGKYKGKELIDIASEDPNYIEWLKTQDWLKEDFKQQIINININGSSNIKQDTPEHNKLQAKIFKKLKEKENAKNIYPILFPEINKWEQFTISKLEIEKVFYYKHNIYSDIFFILSGYKMDLNLIQEEEINIYNTDDFFCDKIPLLSIKKTKENIKKYLDKYADYFYGRCNSQRLSLRDKLTSNYYYEVVIEIKPILSDDFMNIIRQITKFRELKPNIKLILIFESFKITNLNYNEVKEIFKSKNIDIFSMEELK